MSTHERSFPWLVCFQFLLPRPSTPLDPYAFLMTKIINLGVWVGWKWKHCTLCPFGRVPEVHTPRECSERQVQEQERHFWAWEVICSLPEVLRVERILSKGLVIYTCVCWSDCQTGQQQKGAIFPFCTHRLNDNTYLWMAGWNQEVANHLNTKFFCDRKTQFKWRGLSKCSHPTLTELLHSPSPSNRTTQFGATYSKPSPVIFCQTIYLTWCRQVDSSISNLKLVLFQRSMLDPCFRGFYSMQL